MSVISKLDPSQTPLDGWYYCSWDINLSLVDSQTGTVMTDVSRRGRSGQLTVERSKEKAVYDMDNAVKEMTADLIKKLLAE